jgi:membrane-associated phospholipid phosphatase
MATWLVLAIATLLLLALAVTVDAGWAAGLDQWSVDHVMPYQDHPTGEPSPFDRATSPLAAVRNSANSTGTRFLFALTIPVGPVPGVLLVGTGAAVLIRRGRRKSAAAWCGVVAAALVAEAAIKHLVERPLLHKIDPSTHVALPADTFTRSFPSGHTIRAVILAGLVVELAPQFAYLAFTSAGITSVLTVLLTMHTPTDVVGGALLGFILLVIAWRGTRPVERPPGSSAPDGEPHGRMQTPPTPFRSQRVE